MSRAKPPTRYLEQAQREYIGTPDAVAYLVDNCGERYELVRMQREDGTKYVLAWIGAEYAESPDEFDINDLPEDWHIRWKRLRK